MKRRWILAGCLLAGLGGFLTYAGYFDREVLQFVPGRVAHPASRPRLAAVYFSGDVGYRVAMGQAIGDRLADDGIPLVAINSLGFFRQHRTLPEVTALIGQAIRQALAQGQADQVVLIGHSLGADALQAGLSGLPADLRAKVRLVVLIVPTRQIYLRISPAEMLDLGEPDAGALPSLFDLTWAPLECIYGEDEADSPCPLLSAPNVSAVALPGGHALHWDSARIYAAIRKAIDASVSAKVTKGSG